MRKILIQLDTDQHPSTFDRVVAIDAGVDELFSYGGVTPDSVEPLVHGAMFTRSPKNLQHTAIFVGGSDVAAGEQIWERVRKTFFGPVCVSVMMDANGSNTTASAAVLSAGKHLDYAGTQAAILGGTGPVGLRAAELLARRGATVTLYSRSLSKAESACALIEGRVENANMRSAELGSGDSLVNSLGGTKLLIAAGAAGIQFLSAEELEQVAGLSVAIDLNAVPPEGLGGIRATDKCSEKGGFVCYGAIGVGGLKMRIHKAAINRLFDSNEHLLDTEEIFALGELLD